jgi:hypothetical protein
MNMGLLSKHASTVPLVLNLDSGYINSQLNIVFDNWFATVAASVDSLPDLNSPAWSQMFGDSTFQFRFDDDDHAETWLLPTLIYPRILRGPIMLCHKPWTSIGL